MRKIRTVTLDVYRPFGTSSCTAVGVAYRGKVMQCVRGPNASLDGCLRIAKAWAYDNGFTHYRMLGERAINLLEAPKCNTTH